MVTRPLFKLRMTGVLLALAFTSNAYAQFKCVDREKRVTFQQHPCPATDQSTTLKIAPITPTASTDVPATPQLANSGTSQTPRTDGNAGRTYRGQPCPTASEMADLESKIAKMRQKNPDIPDGTREMLLAAAVKTRDDVKKACN